MMSAKPKLRTVSGLPPLSYKAKKAGTLSNYRIYGNTVSGESVGDRTGNLFDAEIVQGSFNSNTGAIRDATNRIRSNESDFIYLTKGTYTINADGVDDVVRYAYSSEDTSTFLYYHSITSWQSLPHTFTVQTPCYFLFGFRFSDDSDIIPSDISNIMLNSGSTALPYEPYGYRVPVTVTNGTDTQTTNIYLPEPLTKSGDNADYIDYATQKRHNSDGTESSVTLPEISTFAGTNTLSVGTTVQPSAMEVTGRIKSAE